jgi:hypothetical protein
MVPVRTTASPDHPNGPCTAGARLLRSLPLLVLLVLLVAGCGDDSSGGESGAGGSSAETAVGAQDAGDDSGGSDAGAGAEPTRAARAAARRFDVLVTEYAPVSARVNFLVTAETLRRDAVESGSGEDVELERTGQVRVELRRMRDVLAAARPNVAGANVSSEPQRQLQQLLLAAIDARRRSLVELDLALDAIATELADSVVDERYEAWDASWNESLRAARAATTLLQDRRARLGLEPALEESIR